MIWVIGHRRSGAHFFMESIKRNFRVDHIWKNHCLAPGARKIIEKRYPLPGSSDPSFYIVRDGRDVLVSFYHWCKKSGEFRLQWGHLMGRKDWEMFPTFLKSPVFIHQGLPFGECKNPIEYWKLHVESWLSTGIKWFRYEDLHRNPQNTLKTIGMSMELEPKPKADFKKVERLVGFMPRRGLIGDWKNYFPEEEYDLFDGICGDLMKRLGYA